MSPLRGLFGAAVAQIEGAEGTRTRAGNRVRAELAQVQGGSLSPQLQQDLGTLQQTVAQLQTKIASLETTIESAEGKAPSQLQGRLAGLDARLSDLDGRLTALEDQIAAVLKSPSEANVERLDPALA